VFSDIAVAANIALRDYPSLVKRILIIDLDVHQGNGNAVLFAGNSAVYTFSMHCSANYFSAKQSSDLDVEVPAGTGDTEYLALLRTQVIVNNT
jgi:acetoin utilization deacetylase AcuC-like enzyme